MPSYEAQHAQFERRHAQVLGVSVDSIPCHKAWAKSLGGISTYPLLSDFHPKGEVSRRFGVYKDDAGVTDRAVILIDKKGIVRYIDIHADGEQPDNQQIFEELDKLN
jgi:alkyl hydroperoxide reductase subunit AhpC